MNPKKTKPLFYVLLLGLILIQLLAFFIMIETNPLLQVSYILWIFIGILWLMGDRLTRKWNLVEANAAFIGQKSW